MIAFLNLFKAFKFSLKIHFFQGRNISRIFVGKDKHCFNFYTSLENRSYLDGMFGLDDQSQMISDSVFPVPDIRLM